MKDVISADELLGRIFAYGIDWQEFKDTSEHDHDVSTFAGKIKAEMRDELKSQLHSLLISKLPEKKILEGYESPWGWTISDEDRDSKEGYNSALDDVKAVLAEMFGVGDE